MGAAPAPADGPSAGRARRPVDAARENTRYLLENVLSKRSRLALRIVAADLVS